MFKKTVSSTQRSTSTPAKSTPAMITGRESEQLAEQYLLQQGLKLLTRNYLCKVGEIDLIMRDQEHLVFVEVRYRNNRRYGSASESVTFYKQQRLIRAAQFYLQNRGWHTQPPPCRFDVVAIDGTLAVNNIDVYGGPSTDSAECSTNKRQNPIEWIPNAFTT
jgi:putative endonuclease